MNKLLFTAAAVSLFAVGACETQTKAPFDAGVCYSVTPAEDGKSKPTFNVLARDQPQMEYCAAQLEAMRVQFLRMGGSRRDIIGSYQGQFIFIDRAGVWTARTLEGSRYFALARTGDGRLAVPGAIERPPEAPAVK